MMQPVTISTPDRSILVGPGQPLLLLAGPCVLESGELAWDIAREMKTICARLGISYVFKASFDKANRTSLQSFRGPGVENGIRQLGRIRSEVGRLRDAPLGAGIRERAGVGAGGRDDRVLDRDRARGAEVQHHVGRSQVGRVCTRAGGALRRLEQRVELVIGRNDVDDGR